jgi:hypothetical protein
MKTNELRHELITTSHKYDEVAEETAYRIAQDVDLESLISAYADSLIDVYMQDPDIMIRDAITWGVVDEPEDWND